MEQAQRLKREKSQMPTAKSIMLFAVFFLILLAVHIFIEADFGDDVHYAGEWGKEPLSTFLKNRYDWWSSRVVIEATMMPLAAAPVWVWKLLDIAMLLLLVYNAADLFAAGQAHAQKGVQAASGKMQAQLFFFAGLWMIPLLSINGAGWITTTTNYLWALALGLVALRPLKHCLCREKCAAWEWLACPLCTLYAANMEQMGAILCGAYLVCGAFLLIRDRRALLFYAQTRAEKDAAEAAHGPRGSKGSKALPCLILLQTLLVLWMLYFVLSSPGNGWRNQYEIERYFPEFEFLSTWEKLHMGFLETGQYYLTGGDKRGCYIFALLSGALLAAALQKKIKDGGGTCRKRLAGWCGLLAAFAPVGFYWGVGHLGSYLLSRAALPRGGHIVGVLCHNHNLPGLGAYTPGLVALQTAVYLFLLLCTALAVWYVHGRSGETLLEWTVLAAGLASRVIMGFSPTIYISGERTALFCSMAFLIVAFRNIQIFWGKAAGWQPRAAVAAYMALILAGNLYCNKPYLF